jgi:hypothetical protein
MSAGVSGPAPGAGSNLRIPVIVRGKERDAPPLYGLARYLKFLKRTLPLPAA